MTNDRLQHDTDTPASAFGTVPIVTRQGGRGILARTLRAQSQVAQPAVAHGISRNRRILVVGNAPRHSESSSPNGPFRSIENSTLRVARACLAAGADTGAIFQIPLADATAIQAHLLAEFDAPEFAIPDRQGNVARTIRSRLITIASLAQAVLVMPPSYNACDALSIGILNAAKSSVLRIADGFTDGPDRILSVMQQAKWVTLSLDQAESITDCSGAVASLERLRSAGVTRVAILGSNQVCALTDGALQLLACEAPIPGTSGRFLDAFAAYFATALFGSDARPSVAGALKLGMQAAARIGTGEPLLSIAELAETTEGTTEVDAPRALGERVRRLAEWSAAIAEAAAAGLWGILDRRVN